MCRSLKCTCHVGMRCSAEVFMKYKPRTARNQRLSCKRKVNKRLAGQSSPRLLPTLYAMGTGTRVMHAKNFCWSCQCGHPTPGTESALLANLRPRCRSHRVGAEQEDQNLVLHADTQMQKIAKGCVHKNCNICAAPQCQSGPLHMHVWGRLGSPMVGHSALLSGCRMTILTNQALSHVRASLLGSCSF